MSAELCDAVDNLHLQKSCLILLDVNGVLCFKIGDKKDIVGLNSHFLIPARSYTFLIRPGIKDLIDELVKRGHTVAIFSSTYYSNIITFLKEIFGQKHPFSFIADRHHTIFDPDVSSSPTSFETIKMLSSIWNNPVFNEKRQWNENNTIIVDNSDKKVRFNDSKNVLIVPEFNLDVYKTCSDDLKELEKSIHKKIEDLTF